MKRNLLKSVIAVAVIAPLSFLFASSGTGQNLEPDAPRIAWYATLESGLAEAQRSNRPLLFSSAAPHCLGVSGIW